MNKVAELVNEKTCANCQRIYRSEQDFLRDTTRWRLCSQGNLWFNCRCGSTLLLKKGYFTWYAPDLLLSQQAKTVFNGLGNLKQLPHMPNTIMELQLELQNPDVLPKALAAKMKHDPIIGAHVLQVAENLRKLRNPNNSAIHSLEHAIVYIGYKTFSDVLMSAGLRTMKLPESTFDEEEFWRESHVCGAISEHLMTRLKPQLNSDELFLSASLCNIGKLITAFCFPSLASKISRDLKDPKVMGTWRQSEQAYQFPDHSILGEIAAAFWGLPEYVLNAARKHHDTPSPDQGYPVTMTEIAGFANQLTHWVLLQPHRIEMPLLSAFRNRFGLSEKELDALAAELVTVVKSLTT